jgi:hypothetical protein
VTKHPALLHPLRPTTGCMQSRFAGVTLKRSRFLAWRGVTSGGRSHHDNGYHDRTQPSWF